MSVASPVIDYIDPATRRIYLLAGITEYHPVEDIYMEVRNLRRTTESLRPYDIFVTAGGSLPKNAAGTERTPRYAIFHDCKVVLTGDTYISGEQLFANSAGELVGKGKDCIDRVLSPADAYAEYAPPEAEVIVGTGGECPTAGEIAAAVANYNLTGYSQHATIGALLVRNAYNGVIEVNIASGEAGTQFPTGLKNHPVNNIPDALTLLDRFHLSKLKINDNVTIPASTNLNGITFISGATIDRTITIPSTATTNGTRFVDIIVTGTLNGRVEFKGCTIEDLVGIRGFVIDSSLTGDIGFDGSTGQTTLIAGCITSGELGTPDFDIGNAKLSIVDWVGKLTFSNKTGTSVLGVSANGGSFDIAASCTAGMMIFTGVGVIGENLAVGTVVNDDNLLEKVNIANAVLDEVSH